MTVPTTEAGVGDPRFLVDPTSTCLGALDAEEWAPTITVRIGEYHLGVRTNDRELDVLLRQLLHRRVVNDVTAPANFTLRIADTDTSSAGRARRGTGFHFLYRSSARLVRTRDPVRVVSALLGHLTMFEPGAEDDLVAIQGVALVRNGHALVAPLALRQWAATIERRLNLRGFQFVDRPAVLIEPARREVVIPEPAIDADPVVFDAIRARLAASRPDPPVAPGRYPLSGWAFLGTGEDLSRAHAVALASRLVLLPGDPQQLLDSLAHVMRGIEPHTVPWSEAPRLVEALEACA